MKHMKQFKAAFLATFCLVLGGCGSAVLAAAFPNLDIGLLRVACEKESGANPSSH